MMGRIWIAYKLELAKAVRLKATYIGPLLVVVLILFLPFVRGIGRDGASSYAFVAYSTSLALDVVVLLLVLIYSSALVSGELGSGTMRIVLVRPLRRREFLAAKLLHGMTYAAGLTALVAGMVWITAMALGELTAITYGGEVLFTLDEMGMAYGVGLLLSLLPQFAAVGFAVMLSTLTRSVGTAITASVGLWAVLDVAKYPLFIEDYFFGTYIERAWGGFRGQCDALDPSWFPMAYYCVAVSLVSYAVFAAVAGYVLSRRNLTA